MNINYIHPADQLVMFMQRIYDKGLTTTSGGNLSIMDDDGNIWITPAGVDKGTLTSKDIICVKPDGTCVGPHRPSSEYPFHAAVYKMRPDLKAVLHAHPPALVSFSTVRQCPKLDLLPSVRKICPEVKIAVYAVPGSDQLGENIGKCFAEGCDIVLLENHGVCIGAQDMFTAFQRFETLDYSAYLEILARRIGELKVLPPEAHTVTQTTTHLKMDDFIPNSHSSEELGKVPSRAVGLHQKIYETHPEIRAVLLAHPVHAMAFAVTDAKFDPRTIPESYILLRDVKRLPYGKIYTHQEETAKDFGVACPAIMVENECVIVTGESLLQAFDRLEVMESTAHSIINSMAIGNIVHISQDEVNDLKVAFNLKD